MLVHRCTINRNTETVTQGEVTLADDGSPQTLVPCLLQEGPGRVNAGQAGEALQYDAIIFFRETEDIRPRAAKQNDRKDIITITTPASGGSFLCQFAANLAGMAGGFLTAYVSRYAKAT